MRFFQICPQVRAFVATVALDRDHRRRFATTTINAPSLNQAYSMLSRLYGERSVLNVRDCPSSNQIHRRAISKDESADKLISAPSQRLSHDSQVLETPTTPRFLSPEEQRVKAMSDQAKRLKQQAKQLKAQQQLKSAQAQLNAATKP